MAAALLAPAAASGRRDIGGKAEGLLRLQAAGAPVPAWRVLVGGADAGIQWREAFDGLNKAFGAGVAVRSSALTEDRAAASQAGQYHTQVAENAEDLPGAVARVLASGGEGMAAVLQAYVLAEMAGVLFSAHPSAARPDAVYCEAVLGAGAALVGGEAEPSRFELHLPTAAYEHWKHGADGPDDLPESLPRELVQWLLRIEPHFKAPLDIEWVWHAGALYFVQARPIVRLALSESLQPDFCATSWFFDQRFTEPMTPITRTALLPLILETAILEPIEMRRLAPPRHVVHYYAGQCYVAHEAYRLLLYGVPRRVLTPDLRQLFRGPCCCESRGNDLPQVKRERSFREVVKAQWPTAMQNARTWDAFRKGLSAALGPSRAVSADNASAWLDEWEVLQKLSQRLLRIHRWSLFWADYEYMLFRAMLRRLPEKRAQKRDAQLREQTQTVTALANNLRRRALAAGPDSLLWKDLLQYCGHRSASLDYAEPTWAELAESGAWAEEREKNPPPAPEPPPKPSRLLKSLVRLLEMREEQRFDWERILARQRALLKEAGRSLAEAGALEQPEDVWWLEWDELTAMLRGEPAAATQTKLQLRRHAHYVYRPARRTRFIGPESPPAVEEGERLRGIGASAGRAEGAVEIADAHGITRRAAGTIIVATTLNPSQTALIEGAAGIVLERGGLLSHAAILAREYGTPLVVGVEDVTRRLRPGQRVSIDGSTGIVEWVGEHGVSSEESTDDSQSLDEEA